jgi:hypothetical protein
VHNSSVYSSTNPNEDIFDNVPMQHQSSPINPNQSLNPSDPIPHSPLPIPKDPINNTPPCPILMDLDPDEVSLDSTHSPPRPTIANSHHTSFLQQSPEPPVALSGCTDAISDIPSLSPVPSPERIPSQLPPNPPVFSLTSTSQQTYPDPLVALSGGTDHDGECGPNQPSNPNPNNPHSTPSSPNSASPNPFIIPPPLSESFLMSSSNMPSVNNNTPSSRANLEPTVALNGYTVGNSDAGNGENTLTGDVSNSSNTNEFVREWSSRISTAQSLTTFVLSVMISVMLLFWKRNLCRPIHLIDVVDL